MQLLCEILLIICFILVVILLYLYIELIRTKPTIIHLLEPKHHTYEEWLNQCSSRRELNEMIKTRLETPIKKTKECPCIWRSANSCKICKQEV